MRLKKFFSLFIILGIIGIPSTLANNNAKNIALDYISEFENFGPFWNSRNPSITAETPFFTYDDKNPSYIEYKVSCNDDINCGFVLVNIDGSDVSVPMASTSGKTLSEQLGDNGTSKNFYFDVFNQFSISNSGKISSISPENNSIDNGDNIYSRSIDKNPLYEKFLDLQKNANDNKENNLKRQEFSKYSTRSLKPTTNDYGLVPGKIIGNGCNSIVPCYKQAYIYFPDNRNNTNDKGKSVSGCTSTAFSMIYGYYDRNGYPDLIPGTAPAYNNIFEGNDKGEKSSDINIRKLQEAIGEKMGTRKVERGGETPYYNSWLGWAYFLDKGYTYTEGDLNGGNKLEKIKNSIKKGHPIMLNVKFNKGLGHSIVVYGYHKNSLITNLGYGLESGSVLINTNGNNIHFLYDGEHNGEIVHNDVSGEMMNGYYITSLRKK